MPEFRDADGNIISEGAVLQLKPTLVVPAELGDPGNIYVVARLLTREESEFPIGVVSEKPISGWHNLEGKVADGHGYWLHTSYLRRYFIVYNSYMEITKDVEFKKHPLKGMKCRIVTSLSNGDHIVELEENVGGLSADGLGKQGHCVVISPSHLKTVKEKKSKKGK